MAIQVFCPECNTLHKKTEMVIIDVFHTVTHQPCYNLLTGQTVIDTGTFKDIAMKHELFKYNI